jgi:hypothetical protein
MRPALLVIQILLAAGAVGGMYEFLVVRRCGWLLWLVANTCSVLILLFLAASWLAITPVAFALAAVMCLYGVEGLLIFGWQAHPAIVIPQILHTAMLTANVLLWTQSQSTPNAIGWSVGLGVGFAVRYLQRRSLRMRHDTDNLARDPVIGHIFARLTRSGKSNVSEKTHVKGN